MTENMKKFLELVSNNEELKAKLTEASKDYVIALAKEQGITLTDADFEQSGEISDDELNAVSGGTGISYFIDHGGEPVKVAIGNPNKKPKPIRCLFQGISKR